MSARTATWIGWSMWAISLPFAAFGGGVLGFLSANGIPRDRRPRAVFI